MWKGIALDHVDDHGELLRGFFPDPNTLPPFVKLATVSEESDAWALDTVDSGERVQQYPIGDAGNTWLSSLYFQKTAKYLPHDTQRNTAVKLANALRSFNLEVVPSLERATLGDTEYVVLEPTIEKVAAAVPDWVPDHQKVRTSLVARTVCLAEDGRAELLEDFKKLAFTSAQTMQEQLLDIDNKYGLIKYWGKIPTPQETVLPLEQVKTASLVPAASRVFLGGKYFVSEADLVKLAASPAVSYLPKTEQARFTADPVGFFSGLNKNAQEAVLEILRSK